MSRNQLLKTALILFVFVLLFVLAAGTAYAVPALPGAAGEGSGACRSHCGALVTLDDIPVRSSGATCAPSIAPVNKSIPLITIVIGFSNVPYEDGFNWAEKIYEGPKSLAAYYTDMSLGKFTFTPAPETSAYGMGDNTNEADAPDDGVVHVKLSSEHKDWANEDEYPALALAIIDALTAADPYVDFASFDADRDGMISTNELAVGYVFAGYEGAASYTYPMGVEKYLWAHAWSVSEIIRYYDCDFSVPAPDGTVVDAYISIAEQMDETTPEPISVLAHELGHYLGLPDLYDTANYSSPKWNKYSVSDYSVMADGSWGIDPDGGYIPYSMDVWSRFALGWCDPVVADSDGDYEVTAQSYTEGDAYSAVYIPTQREGEYYLLENRQFVKWDAGLGRSHDTGGVILWHIDDDVFEKYNKGNEVNNTYHRPAVMPLYPERKTNGTYTFIGNAAFVLTSQPFFSASSWASLFGENAAPLDLPLYGSGADADTRSARILSGLKVSFLDDSAPQMTVRFSTADHVEFLEMTPGIAATCTEPGRAAYWTCGYCGAAYADAAGTEPVADPKTLVIPAGHNFDAGIAANVLAVYSASTCQTKGSGLVKCSRCDATETVDLPLDPNSHEFGGWEPGTPSTCVTYGNEKRVCPCGAQDFRPLTALDPDNHEFGDWETVTPSTCMNYGSEKRVCPCGKEETRALTALDPGNHEYGDWETVLPSTCVTYGKEKRVCPCGAEETRALTALDPDNHVFGAWQTVTPSTCLNYGSEKRVCPCGKEETRALTALDPENHEYGDWETVIPSTCTVRGSEKRVCPCGAEETRELALDPNNHTFGEWETVTAATCHTTGLSRRTCACGAADEKELEKDPAAHDGGTEVRGLSPATCTEDGYTGDTYCLGCGALLVSGEKESAAGHKWSEWTVAGETTMQRECAVCHLTETCDAEPCGEDQKCGWCGKYHVSGILQRLIGFFHKIFLFFARLAGVR